MQAIMPYGYDQQVIQMVTQALADPQAVELILETSGPGQLEKIVDILAKYSPNTKVHSASQVPIGYVMGNQQTVTTTPLMLPENSSATSTVKGYLPQAATAAYDSVTKKFTLNPYTVTQGVFTALNVVNQAYIGTSVACALGKTIDSVLYNANPDFWDSHGMSSLNPETWGSLTVGETGLGATLFNTLLGINPATSESQMYIDEDLFAYMAQWLSQNINTDNKVTGNPDSLAIGAMNTPFNYYTSPFRTVSSSTNPSYSWFEAPSTINGTAEVRCTRVSDGVNTIALICASSQPFSVSYAAQSYNTVSANSSSITVLDKTFYYAEILRNVASNMYPTNPAVPSASNVVTQTTSARTYRRNIAYLMLYGPTVQQTDGISDQPEATLPDTSTWNDLNATKQSLQQQYPDLWTNAATYPVYNPDTDTTTNHTYVPVPTPYPSVNTNPQNDLKPTTQGQTQTQAKVDTSSLDQLKDLISQLIAQPVDTTTDTPETGDGASPVPSLITGTASTLWSVYNPTQQQVDALGAWLWSTNFLDSIAKMWQDPMQGIISLHQIYATPPTGPAQNIKVGYLDSGVSSLTIPTQYSSVSCGNAQLPENFGNVFDYHPYTRVHLYLPFCGMIPLDVGEVMRSTITVNCNIDWFTGAMLWQVFAARDGYQVLLYEFGADGAVRYPLSQGTNTALVSTLASAAVGAGSLMLGGALAGAAVGSTQAIFGGLMGAVRNAPNMRGSVTHTGGFSGNSGAMGIKRPYLVVTRPITYMPSGYESLMGNPDYKVSNLGAMSGFIKCAAMHVDNIPCTDTEMDMIHKALIEGVLV